MRVMALLNKKVRRQCCHRVHPSVRPSVRPSAERKKMSLFGRPPSSGAAEKMKKKEDDDENDEGEEERGRKTQKVQINEANVVACLADSPPRRAPPPPRSLTRS